MESLDSVIDSLRIALGDRLISIVLFGSRARGDATPDSDWDLFVIARDLPEHYFDRHLFFVHALPVEARSQISVLAKTPQEIDKRISPLQLDIAIDGKILYDPQQYAFEKISFIKNLMKQVGLYREHTEAGDQWHWEKQPTGPWTLEWSN